MTKLLSIYHDYYLSVVSSVNCFKRHSEILFSKKRNLPSVFDATFWNDDCFLKADWELAAECGHLLVVDLFFKSFCIRGVAVNARKLDFHLLRLPVSDTVGRVVGECSRTALFQRFHGETDLVVEFEDRCHCGRFCK